MDVDAFAKRARKELLATGKKVRTSTVETRDDLTTQKQIGRLALDGLSNVEIGGRLLISQPTVAHHLRKVSSKLYVSGSGRS